MNRAGCCRRVMSMVMGVVVGALALTGVARGQTGACCLPQTGSCIANAAATQCQSLGGIFLIGQACSACDQTGACCFVPATGGALVCQILSTWACAAANQGTYYGGACAPTPCPTTVTFGVCCPTTGACQTGVPQSQCPAGSPWYGGLTTCTPNPCPHTGACCTAAGGCSQTSASACTSGRFYPNTSCTPSPCPQGVCCNLQTGACYTSAAANCPSTIGPWIANGSCASAPCPSGACCLPDGTCHIANAWECRQHGGKWFANTPCSQANCIRTGACCIVTAASGCVVVPSTQCPAASSFFPGQSCTPNNPCPNIVGACCCPNTACFIAPQSQCQGIIITGTSSLVVSCHWFGAQTCATAPCPPIGACCNSAGMCAQTTLAGCAAPSKWHPNLACSPDPCPATGACCNPDGSCSVITSGGNCQFAWHIGHSCIPNPCPRGGCCNPDTGKCTIVTQAACHDHGGLWLGAGVPCHPLPTLCIPRRGACCFAGSPLCVMTTASNCNGLWFPNKVCAPNPCCPPDYDGRGGVNVSGIFAFLRDWFSGCP